MNEQHDAHSEGDRTYTAPQGFQMFKDHIAAMRRGPRLLGGEPFRTEQEKASSLEDE